MNLIKLFIWFFVLFLNYAIFQANIVVGIVILLIEILIYSKFKGGFLGGRFHSSRPRYRNPRAPIDTSNATLLVLELMKLEQRNATISPSQPCEERYVSEEHKKLRKLFER